MVNLPCNSQSTDVILTNKLKLKYVATMRYNHIYMYLHVFNFVWIQSKLYLEHLQRMFKIRLASALILHVAWRLRTMYTSTKYQINQYWSIFRGILIDCLKGTENKNAEFNHADFPLPTIMQEITQWNASLHACCRGDASLLVPKTGSTLYSEGSFVRSFLSPKPFEVAMVRRTYGPKVLYSEVPLLRKLLCSEDSIFRKALHYMDSTLRRFFSPKFI